MITLSARIAIGFGVFLAIAEVVRNWGDWQPWPWWVVDYIAVALLLFGGRAALPGRARRSAAPLCAGWGFTCAMFYMSFFGHLETLERKGQRPDRVAHADRDDRRALRDHDPGTRAGARRIAARRRRA